MQLEEVPRLRTKGRWEACALPCLPCADEGAKESARGAECPCDREREDQLRLTPAVAMDACEEESRARRYKHKAELDNAESVTLQTPRGRQAHTPL